MIPQETSENSTLLPVSRKVMNLSHILRQSARRFPNEIGLVWGSQYWQWGDIMKRVSAMAGALTLRGVTKGDKILVHSQNCNQLFESMFVCFQLGAVWVPTNFRQTPVEVAYQAQASEATAMICNADFSEHAKKACEVAPSIKFVVSIGSSKFGENYDTLVKDNLFTEAPFADVNYDDPCWFFFTSGTTGKPKAAILTHGQMGFVITNHLCDLMPDTKQSDASLVLAPLSHGAGIHQLVNTARSVKTVLLSSPSLNAEEAWKLVENWKITNMFTVPTIVKLLVEHDAIKTYDHSSLRYVIYAGAPMYREDQKDALKKLGMVLVQYYGLGEVTGNITVLPPDLHDFADGFETPIGTCGYERTGMQVSIQDGRGNEVAVGKTGEIAVCGPAVFAGYYNNTEANQKAFRNGWFLTGDLGHMDEQGFVFITGRSSDMYISGGSNIYPREIEEIILRHPGIGEAVVVGIPDKKWGEVGVAICVKKEKGNITDSEIFARLQDHFAQYKLPKKIFFWDSLPKSSYGKVSKKQIKDELYKRELLPAPIENQA